MIPATAARFIHDPLKPWRRPPLEALRGRRVLWHTLWSETYSNPRYAELLPRLGEVFFAPIRQRGGLLGRIDGGVSRRAPFLERRALDWYRRRGLRLLLTPSPWQAQLFAGPVVVDLDDPSRTTSEQVALTAPNIEHVVVPTESIVDYVRESNRSVEITVVPQGVDVDRARRAHQAGVRHRLLTQLNRSPETVIVGYHAPVICLSTDVDYQSQPFHTYYIDVLLSAVQRLWREGLSFLTLLVGRASPKIMELAQSERRLVLTDYVDRSELLDWVDAFDIGTYPRTVDFAGRQSVKLLEYLVTGAPIVAMMTSETRFVRDASVGSVANDADEFCARLRGLIIDADARRAFRERGREFVAGHDWKTLSTRYEAILADAAEPV